MRAATRGAKDEVALIVAESIVKVYGEGDTAVPALRGVSLSIEPGEFVALIGPSGSGKSTLLHLLGALDTATRGKIVLDGHELSSLDDCQRTALRREKIGFVFQAFNLVPVLSAEENVTLPFMVTGRNERDGPERAERLLAAVGLTERRHLLPSQLSGGEQQRVAIARALVHNPSVLLADELTGSLDQATGREIMKLVRKFHESGQTVVIVTHDVKVASFADRIFLMRDGEIVDEVSVSTPGDPSSLLLEIARFEEPTSGAGFTGDRPSTRRRRPRTGSS